MKGENIMLVPEEFMTSREVCQYIQISMGMLNSLDKSGHLRPRRKLPTNNRRLYSKEDVDAFLDKITTSRALS